MSPLALANKGTGFTGGCRALGKGIFTLDH